jgi:penicillin-binding protein 2
MTFSSGQWNRDRTNPAQFTGRVAVLGGFALVAFLVIFFRLWYLQVLSGDRYLAEAKNNQVREISVQAPRGEILDRDGKLLVGNRTALALQVRTDQLPQADGRADVVLRRVAEIADMSYERVRKDIRRQTRALPSTPVTLRRDVPFELVYYLRENQERFPGVTIDRVYVRTYPRGTMAAQILGYVREVSPEQLEQPPYQELLPGDEVGQDGIELTYDSVLRGVNGETRLRVDAAGIPNGDPTVVREPEPGNDLALSIDADLQAVGEAQLAERGLPGAFVAMDARSGEVLAMGSAPTFDPSVLAKPVVSPTDFSAVFGSPDDESSTGAPAFNRAVTGTYPTGSTFKPITALAALDAGELGLDEVINDPGTITFGDQEFQNAGAVANGPVDLRDALKVSSDVFFYTLGARMNPAEEDSPQPLQDWASDLGLAAPTGIDIPGEAAGLVPNPEWRNDLLKEGLTDRAWSIGDNVQAAIGQGDVLATPLQMAVAYAAIGNGGDVVRPHIGLRAQDSSGRVVQEINPAAKREIEIDPEWRSTVMDGLRAAAMEPGGTSYPVFAGFPVDVAGKTGTAETFVDGVPYDQSWYVAMAPAEDPQVVVAFTIERGGFGVDNAAPATRALLTEWATENLSVKPRQFQQASAEAADSAATVPFE